jgi:Replication protein C (RepC)
MQTSKKTLMLASLEQSFALYEINYALADGIFEPTRKIKDAELRLRKIVRETRLAWDDVQTGKRIEQPVTLTFYVPYALNPQAESILLAIIKLSGLKGIKVEPDQPRLPLFNVEGDATLKTTGKVICKQYQLLKAAGMGDGKRNYKLLEYYLEQMAKVSVKWENHITGWRGMSHLIGYTTHSDGSLIVQLNWRLAGAIFGDYERAIIDLDERHKLGKDASKTLHRWLSAHLWKGKSEYITYDKLRSHIWTQEATKTQQRWRLHTLKKEILPELDELPHWQVEMGKDGAKISHLKDLK